ncbi:hypothetical protein [Spirosoma pulveris]
MRWLLDISGLDHLIVTFRNERSFADDELLPLHYPMLDVIVSNAGLNRSGLFCHN